MNVRKTVGIAVAALVLGLALGGVTSASAVTDAASATATKAAAGAQGLGLRLGSVMRESGARLADVVASLTGKSVEDVRAARAAGTSLEKFAADSGVSAETVIAKSLEMRKDILAAKVKDGTISQAQADTALKNMESRMKERIASTEPCTGDGAGRGGSRRGAGKADGSGMGRGRGGAGGQGPRDGSCQTPAE